jgi:hypothetical protein
MVFQVIGLSEAVRLTGWRLRWRDVAGYFCADARPVPCLSISGQAIRTCMPLCPALVYAWCFHCRKQLICRGLFLGHTANSLFTMCRGADTRQTLGTRQHTLLETWTLPRASGFPECQISGTRQIQSWQNESLPRAQPSAKCASSAKSILGDGGTRRQLSEG